MNFVFYDLETSGLSSGYDQILQFAAIVTDGNFAELERVNLRCQLSSHILPSPIALAVTGVSPKDFTDTSLPTEFEFSQLLRAFINKWAPATWTGYNSLGFDEPHLRQMFFQTLQPNVYETQFNGNNRLDIMLVVQACRIKYPDALVWVKNQKNKISFKLDQIAPGNGFTQHNAHDALGDVEATIFIAQKIAQNAPEFWALAVENRDKQTVLRNINLFEPVQFIQNFYGKMQDYSLCFVCAVGNNGVFFDIENNDPLDYVNGSDEEIKMLLERNPRVIHTVAVNKAPSLFLMTNADEVLRQRSEVLKQAYDFQKRLSNAIQQSYDDKDVGPNRPVEDKIYDGFYDNADKRLLEEFQGSGWDQRKSMLSKLKDPRLIQLGRRLTIFQGDSQNSEIEKTKATEYLKQKWFAQGDVEWTTFAKVDKDLAEIKRRELLDSQKTQELEDYYSSVRHKLEAGELIR